MKEWILNWEAVSPQVRQQILQALVMGLCGVAIGVLRTLETCAVKRIRPSAVTGWVLEVLFWIGGGVVAAEFLYYCAWGAVSFHAFAALVAGFFLWKRVFCREIVTFMDSVFSRQTLTRCGIIKRSVISGEAIGDQVHGKDDETKPFVQKRKRKQRHQYR